MYGRQAIKGHLIIYLITGDDDFVSLINEVILLPTGLTNGAIVCTTIIIVGDTLSEPTEYFNFTLELTHVQDRINNSTTGLVQIVNDDCELF